MRRRSGAGPSYPARQAARVAAGLAALLVALPSTATAHGDVRLVDRSVVLPPGGSARFQGALHYHRLVGRIRADGPVVVRLVQPTTGTVAFQRGPDRVLAFNELIRCCDDRTWTPHVLTLENVGAGPVTVRARVGLVHDDFAVMVYHAESGVRESLVVLSAVWVGVLGWAARRRRPTVSLRRAVAAFGVLLAAVGVLAGYGAARFGTGGVPALAAALAELPVVPSNPLVSRAMLLWAVVIAGWGVAGAWWARTPPDTGRRAWLALGWGMAGTAVLTACLMVSAYGSAGVPAAWAAAAAVPVLTLIAVELLRSPARSGRARTGARPPSAPSA